MKTTNDKILDAYLQHQIYLLQYSEGVTDTAIKLLKKTEPKLRRLTLDYATRLEGKSLSTKRSKALLVKFTAEVLEIRKVAWKGMGSYLAQELGDFSIAEAEFVSKVIAKALPVIVPMNKPSTAELRQLPKETLYEGKILSDHIKSGQRKDTERIVENVKTGLRLRETPSVVLSRVTGTAAAKFRDGAARRAWSGAEALIYTATNTVQSGARAKVGQENTFVITEERFLATLDAGTTPQCMNFDGQVFKIGEGPEPALHWRCRSLRVPFITSDVLGPRTFVPTTERMLVEEYAKAENLGSINGSLRNNLPYGRKASFDAFAQQRRRELIGTLPDTVSYAKFLKGQTKRFQEEVLGVKRAELFRSGNLPLSKFINRRGKFLTLAQLAAKGIS
jgi:hypothetical protein